MQSANEVINTLSLHDALPIFSSAAVYAAGSSPPRSVFAHAAVAGHADASAASISTVTPRFRIGRSELVMVNRRHGSAPPCERRSAHRRGPAGLPRQPPSRDPGRDAGTPFGPLPPTHAWLPR